MNKIKTDIIIPVIGISIVIVLYIFMFYTHITILSKNIETYTIEFYNIENVQIGKSWKQKPICFLKNVHTNKIVKHYMTFSCSSKNVGDTLKIMTTVEQQNHIAENKIDTVTYIDYHQYDSLTKCN